MQFQEVNEQNLSDAAFIHSESWKASHRSFCSESFVEKHTPIAQAEYLRREMAAGKRIYLLLDDQPVGLVSVQESLIENLYVLPQQQNRGYGTALLTLAIGKCTGEPTLWVLSNNQGAYRLYARHGFVKTGNRKDLNTALYEYEMKLERR